MLSKTFIKRLFCAHDYEEIDSYTTTFYGDITHYNYEYKCKKCGKHKISCIRTTHSFFSELIKTVCFIFLVAIAIVSLVLMIGLLAKIT